MEQQLPVDQLSDEDLLRRTTEIVVRSRATEAEMVAHLAELDERRLFAGCAYPSMFAYCTLALRFSEAEAFLRIAAARASRQHPVLLSMLADGRLHLSAIARLAPHLTPANRDAVLARAMHRSKREILELVAELAPRPDAPALIRKLPTAHGRSPASRQPSTAACGSATSGATCSPAQNGNASAGMFDAPCEVGNVPRHQLCPDTVGHRAAGLCPDAVGEGGANEPGCGGRGSALVGSHEPGAYESSHQAAPFEVTPAAVFDGPPAPDPSSTPAEASSGAVPTAPAVGTRLPALPEAQRGSITPTSPGRFKVQFTASRELRDKLERLLALVRERNGTVDLSVVIEQAVSEKLQRLEARRFGLAMHPRTAQVSADAVQARRSSRRIPAAIRRAVFLRDGGRCVYRDDQGRRCSSRERLEFHHRYPLAYGGTHTVADTCLMCSQHHALMTEADFGSRKRFGCGPEASAFRTAPGP